MRRRRSIRASTEFSPPGCTYISRQLCCWHAAKGHHTPPLTVVQPDSLKLWMFNRGTLMSILNTERQPWQNLSRALDKYEYVVVIFGDIWMLLKPYIKGNPTAPILSWRKGSWDAFWCHVATSLSLLDKLNEVSTVELVMPPCICSLGSLQSWTLTGCVGC